MNDVIRQVPPGTRSVKPRVRVLCTSEREMRAMGIRTVGLWCMSMSWRPLVHQRRFPKVSRIRYCWSCRKVLGCLFSTTRSQLLSICFRAILRSLTRLELAQSSYSYVSLVPLGRENTLRLDTLSLAPGARRRFRIICLSISKFI